MISEYLTLKHSSDIFTDTCPALNPPGVTVTYNSAADSNGRYSLRTRADLSCAQGSQLFGGSRFNCLAGGRWNVGPNPFNCVPNDEGEFINELND